MGCGVRGVAEVGTSAKTDREEQHDERSDNDPRGRVLGGEPLSGLPGRISRQRLLDELRVWPYAPGPGLTDGYDDLIVEPPGTFEEVVDALRHGLLDAQTYEAVLDMVSEAPQ